MWELIKNIIKWIIIVALIILLIIGISKIVNKKKVVEKGSQTEIKTIKKNTTDDDTNKTKTNETATDETTKEETSKESITKEENQANNNTTTPEVVEIQDTATSRGITIWLGLFICTTTIIYVNKQRRYE